GADMRSFRVQTERNIGAAWHVFQRPWQLVDPRVGEVQSQQAHTSLLQPPDHMIVERGWSASAPDISGRGQDLRSCLSQRRPRITYGRRVHGPTPTHNLNLYSANRNCPIGEVRGIIADEEEPFNMTTRRAEAFPTGCPRGTRSLPYPAYATTTTWGGFVPWLV